MKTRVLFLSLLALVFCHALFGQDTLKTESNKLDFLDQIDQRNWRVKVPIWVPGFRGSFAYAGITNFPGEGDFSVIDRLNGELGVEFYAIGDIQFKTKKWLFGIDGFHTTLANELKFENIDKVEFLAGIDGTILRSFAGYEVFKKQNKETYFKAQIYTYAGIRYFDLNIYSQNSSILDIRPTWIEPIIGLEIPLQFKRWFLAAQMDVGGFSINNHWSWNVTLDANYRFSKLFALGAGWSVLDFNYNQLYEYKYVDLAIQLSGPILELEFNF